VHTTSVGDLNTYITSGSETSVSSKTSSFTAEFWSTRGSKSSQDVLLSHVGAWAFSSLRRGRVVQQQGGTGLRGIRATRETQLRVLLSLTSIRAEEDGVPPTPEVSCSSMKHRQRPLLRGCHTRGCHRRRRLTHFVRRSGNAWNLECLSVSPSHCRTACVEYCRLAFEKV
jgi:hypothetical protein